MRIYFWFFLLVITNPALGQVGKDIDPVNKLRKYQNGIKVSNRIFWAMTVPDVMETSNWYERVFYLKLVKEIKDHAQTLQVRILENEDFTVEIIYANEGQATDMSMIKVGFFVSDINHAQAYFKEMNIKIKHGIFSDAETKTKGFIIEDPNKMLIQVLEYMP